MTLKELHQQTPNETPSQREGVGDGVLGYWLPFILYAALIFYVSSQPLPELPVRIPYIDRVAHFFEYAVFGYLAYRALSRLNAKAIKKHLVFAVIIISVLYAFSDELHQFYVPGRVMSVSDFIFDVLGATVITLLFTVIRRP